MLKEIVRGGLLNPEWVEWVMNWPRGWTNLEPIRKEHFDDWLQKTSLDGKKDSTKNISATSPVRVVWWDKDPATPSRRWQSVEQQQTECEDSLSEMSYRYPSENGYLGQRESQVGKVCNLWSRIPTKENEEKQIVWKPPVSYRDGQKSSGEAMVIPRVITDILPNRVNRLAAIGEGQVPAVVAAVWGMLGPGAV